MDQVIGLLIGYAVGSIPFGLLLAKAAGKGDIRKIGSGNIGATNVLRTGSKWLAALVLLLDLGKGLAAVLLVRHLFGTADSMIAPVCFAALGAVLGHCFPVWLGFKGGKGVATNAGVSFGLALGIGLAYAVVWLGVLALTRVSSLAGMSAVVAAALAASFLGHPNLFPVLVIIAIVVIVLHRANIRRLIDGTEPRVGGRKE